MQEKWGCLGKLDPFNVWNSVFYTAEKLGLSTIFVYKYNKIALKYTAIKDTAYV